MAWRGYASGDEAPLLATDEQFVKWCNGPPNHLSIGLDSLSRWEGEGYISPASKRKVVKPASERKEVKLYHRDAQVHTIRKIIELEEHGFDRDFMLDILPGFDEWHRLISPEVETHMFHQIWLRSARWAGKPRSWWSQQDSAFTKAALEMRDSGKRVWKETTRTGWELKPRHFEAGHLLFSRLIDETDKRMPELEKYRGQLSGQLLAWLVIEKTRFARCPKGHITRVDIGTVVDGERREDGWHIWVQCTHSKEDRQCAERFDIADRPWRPLRWVEGRKQVCLMCGQAFDLVKNRYRAMCRCKRCQRRREGARRQIIQPFEYAWRALGNVLVGALL